MHNPIAPYSTNIVNKSLNAYFVTPPELNKEELGYIVYSSAIPLDIVCCDPPSPTPTQGWYLHIVSDAIHISKRPSADPCFR